MGRREMRVPPSLLHPRILRGVGEHGRAAVINTSGAQLVVPRFVPVDLAQPEFQAVLGQPFRVPHCPVSMASPPTWAEVAGEATHRAAAVCEPYFETASSSNCS